MTTRTAATAVARLEAALSERAAQVETALADLLAVEEKILRLRYGLGGRRHSQLEIARLLGVGVGRVRRAERRAVRTLRAFSLPPDFATVPCPPPRRAPRALERRAVEVLPDLVPPSRRGGGLLPP